MIPGSRWEEVPGTDKQLALALAEQVEVLWVDPPTSAKALLTGRGPRRYLHEVARGVHRLQTLVPPAATRPGVRRLADALVRGRIQRELRDRRIRPLGTIILSARGRFLDGISGRRMLFVTDDWPSGAALMGLSVDAVTDSLDRNLRVADEVAAVTKDLADLLIERVPEARVTVIPNGTTIAPAVGGTTRERVVGLVGQLNERLDLEVLTAVADAGLELLVVGPRTEREPAVTAGLNALLDRPNVTATGPVPHAELRRHLARVKVGLTPYADNAFNRSSFPLKTLEYLGAGLPVVSTDLPAARWLNSPHVAIAANAEEVVLHLVEALDRPVDPAAEDARRAYAGEHTWAARSEQVLALLRA